MNPESQSNESKALADVPPLRRDIRSPGAWRYFINYLALGSSAVIILIEIIQSGALPALWVPLILTVIAMMNLADMQATERRNAEPGAAPNGGPAMRPGNSGAGGGPPSVS